jgi:Polysaccharide biosynthesis enzyme WcbI
LHVLVAGNCQAAAFAQCLRLMLRDAQISHTNLLGDSAPDLGGYDLICLQAPWHDRGECGRNHAAIQSAAACKVIAWPPFVHYGFHPDVVYATSGEHLLSSPLSYYNSALVIFGWQNGLTVEQTLQLFCEEVFEYLSYYSYFEISNNEMIADYDKLGLDARVFLEKWLRRGCFAHAVNHPKLFVVSDFAEAMCNQHGLKMYSREVHRFLHDDLLGGPVWPVYPEIAARLGIAGSYEFKTASAEGAPEILSLEEFVERSFSLYSDLREPIVVDRFARQSAAFEGLKRFLSSAPSKAPAATKTLTESIVTEVRSAGELVCEEEALDPLYRRSTATRPEQQPKRPERPSRFLRWLGGSR